MRLLAHGTAASGHERCVAGAHIAGRARCQHRISPVCGLSPPQDYPVTQLSVCLSAQFEATGCGWRRRGKADFHPVTLQAGLLFQGVALAAISAWERCGPYQAAVHRASRQRGSGVVSCAATWREFPLWLSRPDAGRAHGQRRDRASANSPAATQRPACRQLLAGALFGDRARMTTVSGLRIRHRHAPFEATGRHAGLSS